MFSFSSFWLARVVGEKSGSRVSAECARKTETWGAVFTRRVPNIVIFIVCFYCFVDVVALGNSTVAGIGMNIAASGGC